MAGTILGTSRYYIDSNVVNVALPALNGTHLYEVLAMTDVMTLKW